MKIFKDLLFFLDKPSDDALDERISREAIAGKYWFTMGASICMVALTSFLNIYILVKSKNPPPPRVFAVQKSAQGRQASSIISLPYPHQSLKNVTSWLKDAISASYSFNFLQYHSQLKQAAYYFTPEGYATYVNALKMTKVEAAVIDKKLEISIVPMQEPVMINGGVRGDTEFWRFRVPVLASYAAGKNPVVNKYMVEVLIVRVPAYKNHKGLSIAEFNMKAM